MIIGLADGTLDADTTATGVDSWAIQCLAGITELLDPQEARQACEDAVNDLADLFERDDRLGMAVGPRDVRVAAFATFSDVTSSGNTPFVRTEFEIRAAADIWRNQP